MESVVDEAFEVQVLQPFHGWTFERFCDRSGNPYPELTRAAIHVTGRADRLNAVRETPTLEVGALEPASDWMWSHAWMVDSEYTQCDDDGWTYGSSMARMNGRLAAGTSKSKRGYYHLLRRRRWIRTRVRTPPLAFHSSSNKDAQSSSCSAGDRRSIGVDAPLVPDASALTRVEDKSRAVIGRSYRVAQGTFKAYLMSHVAAMGRPSQFLRVEFTDDDLQKEGWLGVRGTLARGWKLRYFLLRWDSSSLVCLRDRASMVQVMEELIDRHTTLLVEEEAKPRQFHFSICNGDRALQLNAVDGTSRASWISALSELIVRSRASFFAVDESESGSRSQSFRRMRSSTDEDGSVVGCPSIANDIHGDSSGAKQKHARGAWRPYKFISSTMQSKRKTDACCRREYAKQFCEVLNVKTKMAATFIAENIDILEENLCFAQEYLPSAMSSLPKKEIKRLRTEADATIEAFRACSTASLVSGSTSVLKCNMLLKELYLLVRRLQESVISLAPSQEHATIKKIVADSPTKRRIPVDWFTESVTVEKGHQQPSSSEESLLSTSTSISTAGKLELSYTSGSSLEMKVPNAVILSRHEKRSSSVPESNRSTSTVASHHGHSLRASEAIRIKPYAEMPSALREGHFDLPDGVNGYVVKVHEKDIGSLIGYTLCSTAYIEQLEAHFENKVNIAEELLAPESVATNRSDASVTSAPQSEGLVKDVATPAGTTSPSSRTSTAAPAAMSVDAKRMIYLDKLRSADLQHTSMKFSYAIGSTTHEFHCVAYFAAQFHALRALIVPGNVEFLNSIIESKRWSTTGGKSGAFFSMTHDKRYVLKGISVTEFNMFVHMAPKYFKFISRVVEVPTPTVITKIVGLFKLSQSRRLLKHTEYVVIMENFSYGFPPGQMYDLKGILRRRYNPSSRDNADHHDFFNSVSNVQVSVNQPVLLDGNFSERTPVPVSQPELETIEAAIQNDIGFLYRAGVIDYSLLLRFDEEKRQVVVGLIDYLHQFDFLKKMESTSKASLTFRDPTVISPISYRRRFMNAVNRYFVGIEKELEIRMRKRCGHKTKPAMLCANETVTASSADVVANAASPPTSRAAHTGAVRTDEELHADVAARLVDNMSLTSECSVISEQSPVKSECHAPTYDSDWTSMKPRGYSVLHMCYDESSCNGVSESDCECDHTSPCSLSEHGSVKKSCSGTPHSKNTILEERCS